MCENSSSQRVGVTFESRCARFYIDIAENRGLVNQSCAAELRNTFSHSLDPKRTSEPVSTSLDYNVLLCCAAQYGDRRWLSCSFQLPVCQLGLDCSSFFSVLFGRGFATRARKATLLCSASCWHSSSSGDSPTVTSIRIPRRSAYRKGRSTRWPLNRPATGPASRYGP